MSSGCDLHIHAGMSNARCSQAAGLQCDYHRGLDLRNGDGVALSPITACSRLIFGHTAVQVRRGRKQERAEVDMKHLCRSRVMKCIAVLHL